MQKLFCDYCGKTIESTDDVVGSRIVSEKPNGKPISTVGDKELARESFELDYHLECYREVVKIINKRSE